MTKKFEYDVLISNNASERYTTRHEARKAKSEYKAQGFDAKIIQRKWEVTKEVEVR